MANKDIFENIVILDNFTQSLRSKFKIVNDCYKILKRYYKENPISYKHHALMSRYQIGVNFLKTFALNPLTEDEIAFALNIIYSTIGIEQVIFMIANFTGIKVKVEDTTNVDKKLTITIISESIFDLDLFQVKLTDFLNDVLMFQNLEYIFDLIVLSVNLEYYKKLYNLIEYQNIIPCLVDKEFDVGDATPI